jgi:hypothetical protein
MLVAMSSKGLSEAPIRNAQLAAPVTGNVNFSISTGRSVDTAMVVRKLDTEFNFTVDVCATPNYARNHKMDIGARRSFTRRWRSARRCWRGRIGGGFAGLFRSYLLQRRTH